MLITNLIDKGWHLEDHFLSPEACQTLINEIKDLKLRQAHIGKGAQQQQNTNIRTDQIFWVEEGSTPIQAKYLQQMNEIMITLNQELYLGLRQFESHFARYENAGFYKKHLDQHSGSKERVVSAILYLNDSLGGELALYSKDNPEKIEQTIKPGPGKWICFLSNQIYHEVLPTQSERYTWTGWFRTTIL